MRKDFLLFLSFLVDAGYIVSFRVTKDKIFMVVCPILRALLNSVCVKFFESRSSFNLFAIFIKKF